MTPEEREGQLAWFTDLREAVEADDKESALEAIDAAINLLQRENNP